MILKLMTAVMIEECGNSEAEFWKNARRILRFSVCSYTQSIVLLTEKRSLIRAFSSNGSGKKEVQTIIMKVEAVCISKKKGTPKVDIGQCQFITDYGLTGDAHAGKWHRQVSLLSREVIDDFKQEYGNVENGEFGENLIISGCALSKLKIGSKIFIGDTVLEVTQIGKECHSGCSIAKRTGKCIMPEYGVFAEVINGGTVTRGDVVHIKPRFTAAVVTVSDRGYAGVYEDKSGLLLNDLLIKDGFLISDKVIIPDDYDGICKTLIDLSKKADLIITTGGTGLSYRDNTPEATEAVAEKRVPGISEAIRYRSMEITPKAMLGRGSSVVRGKTLIINFPGSPKAVSESYEIIKEVLNHALEILTGIISS